MAEAGVIDSDRLIAPVDLASAAAHHIGIHVESPCVVCCNESVDGRTSSPAAAAVTHQEPGGCAGDTFLAV